jgi:hypothetical protein
MATYIKIEEHTFGVSEQGTEKYIAPDRGELKTITQ